MSLDYELKEPVRETEQALHDLLEYCVGNRGSREGNPYCKPEVRAAIKVLQDRPDGLKWDGIGGTYR